jgi:hypothetical protein
VAKTLIPVPDRNTQDEIAKKVVSALLQRERTLEAANFQWEMTLEGIRKEMYREEARSADETVAHSEDEEWPCTRSEIDRILSGLSKLDVDDAGRGKGKNGSAILEDLFGTADLSTS